MNLPDFLTEHPYGAIRLTGTRIDLGDVIELYKEGHSAEAIQETFPHVPLAQIRMTIEFYLDNRDAVDSYLRQGQEAEERLLAVLPKKYTLEELRARYEARRDRGDRPCP